MVQRSKEFWNNAVELCRERGWRVAEVARELGLVHGVGSDGGACMTLPPGDGYRVITLDASRPGERHFGPTVAVHLSVRAGRPRIIGVAR